MTNNLKVLQAALRAEFPGAEDGVYLLPGRLGGTNIRIVSPDFEGVSRGERRRRVLSVANDRDISALTLLAPSEVGTDDDVQIDETTSELPLWPGRLADAQTSTSTTVHLASQEFEALTKPVIATFYSLRGGVGRTTALAQTAFALSELGLSVLCIDMDLEAPGLATMLDIAEGVESDRGVVRLLSHIDVTGEVPSDLEEHFLRVSTASGTAAIDLLPAGLLGAEYAQDLALLDPAAWFEEEVNPLRILLDGIRNLDSVVRPDVVLIDSRTGLSPISAPLLFEAADIDVIAFLPHPQAKNGTGLLTRALLTAQTMRGTRENRNRTPEPRFIVSPVPPSDENYARAHDRAIEWISEWLEPAVDAKGGKPFDDIEEIVEVIRYSEDAATADSIRSSAARTPYLPIANWIAGLVESDSSHETRAIPEEAEDNAEFKREVLRSLSFDTQTADQKGSDDLDAIFLSTEAVEDALNLNRRLVLGRKGCGKTLLFRRLLLDKQLPTVAITAPDGYDGSQLPLSERVYRQISGELVALRLGWEDAWRAIIGLSIRYRFGTDLVFPGVELAAGKKPTYSRSELLADLRALLRSPDAAIRLEDWMDQIDAQLDEPLHLLFDGLDTGFANSLDTRRDAVTGLLLLLNGQARKLERLQFKIFLREDIFRSVALPNKTHLRAEAAFLTWNDQYDYLRLVIKQAWRSEQFQKLVERQVEERRATHGAPRFALDTAIEYWPDGIVLDVWQMLVGERMSGGKTAFTHNWVWTRLADANGDHAPRHLITLFEEACQKERLLEPGSPNSRLLIRPKALGEALDQASDGAVDAIREEYGELGYFLDYLRETVQKTPIEAELLRDNEKISPKITLASEVGLIGPGPDDRYRVPELYRRALGMNRQGQL